MRISMQNSRTIKEYFDDFIISKKARGLSEKTLDSYKAHFKALSKHLDVTIPIDELTKSELEQMISSMRNTNLAPNSISSYVRTLKSFFSWCNSEDITDLNMQS